MARHATSPVDDHGRAAKGLALFVLELALVTYAFCMVQGTWPPGHPWIGLGAVGSAALLWAGGSSAMGLLVAICGFTLALAGFWWGGMFPWG